MKHEVELELKTIVTEDQFYKLLSFYQPISFHTQINNYYKAAEGAHYGFRIRTIGDRQIFTLKTRNNGELMEYEKEFEGDFQKDAEIIEVLDQFNIPKPYKLLGQLTTDRAVYYDGLAELCFDINHYNGHIDYELEYEVKNPHDHQKAFFEVLAKADISYIPSWASKFKRFLKTIED